MGFLACILSFLLAFFDVGDEVLSPLESLEVVGCPAVVDCLNRVRALKPSSSFVSEVNATDFLRGAVC